MSQDTYVYRNSCNKVISGGSIYYGNAPPKSNVGNNGDFYLDMISNLFYGPKQNCKWNGPILTFQGIPGIPGQPGANGTNGLAGIPGTIFLSGESEPDNEFGDIGNYYLQIYDGNVNLFGPKTDDDESPWGLSVSLIGENGIQGPTGTIIYASIDLPDNNIGKNGDFYIYFIPNSPQLVEDEFGIQEVNYQTILIGPKVNNEWRNSPFALLTGNQGSDGSDGNDGAIILSSNNPPESDDGNNGDFYILIGDRYEFYLYGPKVNDEWGTEIPLNGPRGESGSDGIEGNHILTGVNIPDNNQGDNGDFYFQTSNDDSGSVMIFGPKTNDNWGIGTSLIGSAPGKNGNVILNGTSPPPPEGSEGNFYIRLFDGDHETTLYGPYDNSWGDGIILDGSNGEDGTNGITVAADAINVLLYYNNQTNVLESTGIEITGIPINEICIDNVIADFNHNGLPQISAYGNYLLYVLDESQFILKDVVNNTEKSYPISNEYTFIKSAIYGNRFAIIMYTFTEDGESSTLTFYYYIYNINEDNPFLSMSDPFSFSNVIDVNDYINYPAISLSENSFVIRRYSGTDNYVKYSTYRFIGGNNTNALTLLTPNILILPNELFNDIYTNDDCFVAVESDSSNNIKSVIRPLINAYSESGTILFRTLILNNNLLVSAPTFGSDNLIFYNMENYTTGEPPEITQTLNTYGSPITGNMNDKYLVITTFNPNYPSGTNSIVFEIDNLVSGTSVVEYKNISIQNNLISQTVVNDKYFFSQVSDNINASIFFNCFNQTQVQLLFPDGSEMYPFIAFINSPNTGINYIDVNDSSSIAFIIDGELIGVIDSNGWQSISDPKMKKNMIELTNALDLLDILVTPYIYSFVNESDNIVHYGFNAQELLESYTSKYNIEDNQVGSITKVDDKLLLNYSEYIPVCVSAINELNTKLNDQENKLIRLEQLLQEIINQ